MPDVQSSKNQGIDGDLYKGFLTGLQSLSELQRADHDTLIRLETKFDSYATEQRISNTSREKTQSDHEARIRVLETSSEVSKGTDQTSKDNKRTLIEVIGLIISVGLIIATYLAARHP